MRSNSIAASSNYITANSNTTAASITYNNACTSTSNPTACTPTVLANNDLVDWNTAITNSLTMGKGIVATSTASATNYNLSITWDDNRDGVVDAKDPTFTMELQLK